MKWGFTGSQMGCAEFILIRELKRLNLKKDDIVITGACVGIDSQIHHLVKRNYPDVETLVIVPANFAKVDQTCFVTELNAIFMPKGSSYRDRNTRIVKESDKVVAFWTGRQRSGTYMTINIAKRASKLHKVIHIDE